MSSAPSATESARLRLLRANADRKRIRDEEDARAELEVRQALEAIEREEAAEQERLRAEEERRVEQARLAAVQESQRQAVRVGKRKAEALDEAAEGSDSSVRSFLCF